MVDHVYETQVEAQLRCQLEKRQIQVTSYADVNPEIEALQCERRLFFVHQVEGSLHAGYQIGSVVVDAARADLQADRHLDVVALQLLVQRLLPSVHLAAEADLTLLEVDAWRDSQVQMLRDGHVAHQSHHERRIDIRTGGPPAFASRIARVSDDHIRQVRTQAESPVQQALVVVGQVPDLLLLTPCRGRQRHKHHQCRQQYPYSVLHNSHSSH